MMGIRSLVGMLGYILVISNDEDFVDGVQGKLFNSSMRYTEFFTVNMFGKSK
jgi:hypothetical protein